MRMLRRTIPLLTIVSLLCATCPARVLAMSTQKEIALGQSYDQQIVASSVVETDPLLNAYVQGIAGNLWNQVARKDLPYNVKIIKDSQVNSFATMGGFIYINEGLIDFVQSDDELAGVMGHETGHIERRHVLTSNSKAELIQLLFGIASMFSPIIYAFGGLAEEGLMMKISREDEIQADRYGLQLMSRAGYDPESMVTVLAHLGVLGDEHDDAVSKYLEDHPDPAARVAHLMGYPELDPTVVTPTEKLVQASSDEDRARYSFAQIRLDQVLKQDPQSSEALLEIRAIGARARIAEQERANIGGSGAAWFAGYACYRKPADCRAAQDGRATGNANAARSAELAGRRRGGGRRARPECSRDQSARRRRQGSAQVRAKPARYVAIRGA